MEEPEQAARASLFRSLLLYVALLAADGGVIYFIAGSGVRGAGYVTLTIAGGFGLLVAFHAWQHYRDLNEPLAETTGVVLRKWSRADLVVAMHSYYMMVERSDLDGRRAVFRMRAIDYVHTDEEMYVTIVHFPRTLNVVSVHQVRRPPPPSTT